MKVPKPSDQSRKRFAALVPQAPDVELKPMFGNLGAFVNGNMFAGLFGDSLGVKVLDPEAHERLSTLSGVGPYGPPERPMGGYLALPPDWAEQPDVTAHWIGRALADVRALPPKQPKPRKPRT